MARKIIDIGTVGNDGTGDSIRDSFRKVNENFRELYSSLGLGERLKFINLDDTPETYFGQDNAILSVNATTDGVQFKQIVGAVGVIVDYETNPNQIRLSTEFSAIVGDPNPQLGGNLSATSGGNQYRIQDLTTPVSNDEAANKGYVDTKLSRAGVNTVNPATGLVTQSFGTMSGPLILSRDPQDDDDALYDGLIAATKRYVDGAGFSSRVNLYVATSGQDERPGLSKTVQGRSLASAYRSVEAACKRAEELVNESKLDIGPYKKVLTYGNGANFATLDFITAAPGSGDGFAGNVLMSVDSATLSFTGTNYQPGDILTLNGGTGSPATFEVLTTATTPGPIVTFRQLSAGSYSVLPPDITSVGVIDNSEFGNNTAKFSVTFRVNSINITNGGSGYSLVSVRVVPAPGDTSGSGAFGTANISGGIIVGITIDDVGSGFTAIPTVIANLPRFLIKTENQRTDFTGDVTTNTPEAFRGRDIREGLFLKGETSGALAQILSHDGSLDSDGNEIFDVDIKFGSFIIDEKIAYGDSTKIIQISILVESGIYEENLPLKLPQNVAIIGDEFRRTIIKPRPGISSSPWAFNKFRRDVVIDSLQTATQLYGYHYLTDSTAPVHPKIDNKGGYRSAAALLDINKTFIQNEVIAWINYQIFNNIEPFVNTFTYNQQLCRRDVGLIVESITFDLKFGGYNRTVSAGLKYYQNASGLIAIQDQYDETEAAIYKILDLADAIIQNIQVVPVFQDTFIQVIDPSFSAEPGSFNVIEDLIDTLVDVINPSGSGVNNPKNNDQMDVFLCNDANIVRALTMQGHGGFSMTLDPEGQILAKSPYSQECASFSRSIDRQIFAGGMFVDGFVGNLQFRHETSVNPFRITVAGLDRVPNVPASFIVNDAPVRVNYIRDFVYDKDGSTATFVLDETTPFVTPAGAQVVTHTVADPAVFTRNDHKLQIGATLRFYTDGVFPPGITASDEDTEISIEYYILRNGFTGNEFQVTNDPVGTTGIEITGAGIGTLSYQRIYELLMPGNRSMLSNDFTQVCDLGYGLIATNGGLTEAVSMFTYYCHISYYSLNGGQIRSIGGSSAHGTYALVAEGADPLEVPTPVTVYQDYAQRVVCYAPSPAFANTTNGLFVYVTNYQYTPLGNSELEVDHGNLIFRYPVTSVGTEDLPPGVARLNLTSDDSGTFDGLFAQILDGTVMTIRLNGTVVLTGDIVDVATRPSTGLILSESQDVYRVLKFEEYIDPNGPFEVEFTVATPTVLSVIETIIAIGYEQDGTTPAADLVTTAKNHMLLPGQKFIPKTSDNGLTAGTTYYVTGVPNYNQFFLSTSPGGSTATLVSGTGLSIKGVKSHNLIEDYYISFITSGTLPSGPDFIPTDRYFVLGGGITDTTFRISDIKNGNPIAITAGGSGVHQYIPEGLAFTALRENYNYVDLTIFVPGEVVSGSTTSCTISIAAPAVITTSGNHGLNANDVIRFFTTGNLPAGINLQRQYFVKTVVSPTEFTIAGSPLSSAVAIETTGSQSGSQSFAKVTGRAGDQTFAVVPVAPSEEDRIPNSTFYFQGIPYVITQYENTTDTGFPYARITLDKPLEDSMIAYEGAYTIKSAVPIRSEGADGTLTIRISLTRVTSHDLLEIGTGSYADTNYPNEIYGPAVNALSEANETQERSVGRVFYVTTDQFGNFKVGPYFAVDQGTGRVTFSAAIALSNLDGIGFKRGVPIAEFSVDSGFSDNAIDTVPTENATRVYIERRLGLTHSGASVSPSQLIPQITGGFLALSGLLPMKGNIDMANNKSINLADPVDAQDAVNLRSLTFANLQEFTLTGLAKDDLIVFTGVGNNAINAEVVGDITFNLNTGTNQVDAQIVAGTIINADVNSSAAIVQSKLSMQAANAALSAAPGSFTQSALGLSTFNSAEFVATNGWIDLRTNGISVTKLQQLPGNNVIGNSTGGTANSAPVSFATVIDNGNGVKKSQFGQFSFPNDGSTVFSTGFLRRTSSGTNDNVFQTQEASPGATGYVSSDNRKLVERTNQGNFGGNIINAYRFFLDSASSAGDTSIPSGTAMARWDTSTGGYIRMYGYSGAGGILVSDGSLAGDQKSAYWNNSHEFKDRAGSADAPIRCSQIQTLAITTGGATTSGTITGRWTLTGTSPNESRLQATYSADLAEYYEGDKDYEVGTVLVFGGDKEVTITNREGDARVAGVVSNTAAFAMYEACPGLKNLIALQGRVPCRVVGKIKKGDMLITSRISGVAVAAKADVKVGTVVGKALQDYDSDHIGTIEIAVGRT
jgi:hypothetical protein